MPGTGDESVNKADTDLCVPGAYVPLTINMLHRFVEGDQIFEGKPEVGIFQLNDLKKIKSWRVVESKSEGWGVGGKTVVLNREVRV